MDHFEAAHSFAHFELALSAWLAAGPAHPLALGSEWRDFLACAWSEELSSAERALLSRMDPLDAAECLARGFSNSGAPADDDGRALRRMGRAMHCAELACRSSVMSHPWVAADGARWIDEPGPQPKPSPRWARAALAERMALAGAPWALVSGGAACAIPGAALPAALVFMGGLCLVMAETQMANRARNPHKQSLLSTLDGIYPDLAQHGFFDAARAQPNFQAHKPLDSCELMIGLRRGGANIPRPLTRKLSMLDLLSQPFPSALAWAPGRAAALRESAALDLSTLPPSSVGGAARRRAPRI